MSRCFCLKSFKWCCSPVLAPVLEVVETWVLGLYQLLFFHVHGSTSVELWSLWQNRSWPSLWTPPLPSQRNLCWWLSRGESNCSKRMFLICFGFFSFFFSLNAYLCFSFICSPACLELDLMVTFCLCCWNSLPWSLPQLIWIPESVMKLQYFQLLYSFGTAFFSSHLGEIAKPSH